MRTIAAVAALVVLAACKKAEEQPVATTPSDSLSVADSFRTPESVLYDAVGDVYLVSNINGSPFEKDDNGFISRVNPDGRVDELKFIDGAGDSVTLNAPKGMGIRGDTLFVADIDEVRMFDRTNGQPLGSRRVSGATFLNDVAVGPDGTVYVTDTSLDQQFNAGNGGIYRFDAGGRAQLLVRMRGNGPNGIHVDTQGIYVVSWNGEFAYVSANGEVNQLPRPPHPQLDGLIRLADGSAVASTWHDSSLIRILANDTTWARVMGGFPSPADIGYDTRRSRVLIPLFQDNRVEIRPLR